MKSPVEIRPGVVFWPKGIPGDKIHPYIVLAYPVNGWVLITNFSDEQHDPDAECVVTRHEYPDLAKTSFVFFAKTTEIECRKMPVVLAEGRLATHYPDLGPVLLERVLRAAKSSQEINERLKLKFGLIRPKDKTTAPF